MTTTLERATRIYGHSMRDLTFQSALSALGVPDEPVRVALAEATVEEFRGVFPDITSTPVMVIDTERGRLARLDFYSGGAPSGIEVGPATEMGMLVEAVRHCIATSPGELLNAFVHAQTREFNFAWVARTCG